MLQREYIVSVKYGWFAGYGSKTQNLVYRIAKSSSRVLQILGVADTAKHPVWNWVCRCMEICIREHPRVNPLTNPLTHRAHSLNRLYQSAQFCRIAQSSCSSGLHVEIGSNHHAVPTAIPILLASETPAIDLVGNKQSTGCFPTTSEYL